jgi:hypothetical protein
MHSFHPILLPPHLSEASEAELSFEADSSYPKDT